VKSGSENQLLASVIKPLWKARIGQTVAFSRDGKHLAVGGAHGPVRLLDARTGDPHIVCAGPKSDIYRIAFSPDGKQLAIGPFNKRLTICAAATGKLVSDLRLGDAEIFDLEFNSKTGQLLRTERGTEIAIFQTSPLKATGLIKPDPVAHPVLAAFFSPNGDKLFAVWNTKAANQKVSVTNYS